MKRESKGFSGVETTLFPTMIVTEQVSQGEGPTSPVQTQYTPTVIESSPHLQNISITYRKTRTKTRRMDIRIPQSNVPLSAADDAITKEMYDGLGRATTTASSLEAKQDSGFISVTQTKATPLGQVRMIEEIDKYENVNLVKISEQREARKTAEHKMDFSTASPQTDDDETLAETLMNIKKSA
nr:hypothetical protein [Tanacetum cinerariifolium]